MSGDPDFGRHLEAYLAIRDALGLAAGTRPRLLRSFIDHARGATAPGTPIRAATALAWACDHALPGCGVAGKAHRLTVARGFLAYLAAVVPGTEVPAHGLLAAPRRQRPYIFSDAEIEMLVVAAAKAPPRGSLRPIMLSALLGLLASTGLRIGEAVRLRMDDAQLDARPAHLRILQTKFQKSRLVPVHPTTAAALAHYLRQREALGYHALSEAVFVSKRGGPLNVSLLGRWFSKLTRKLEIWPPGESARRPSLHSFRHSFAVRRLRAWHEAGQDAQALLPTLSVYLGHVCPEDTYWYLTATPDLLRVAG
ncbi:MAG: tyrosine-type recombinase/integrase, partial [Pseudomonadota bacterium]|nr:tyrosine-type recombinase/integrase [Pseudomonadota bacterium]